MAKGVLQEKILEIIEDNKKDPIFHALYSLDTFLSENSTDAENPYGRVGEGGTSYLERIRLKAFPSFRFLPHDIAQIKSIYAKNCRRADNNLFDFHCNTFTFYSQNGLLPHRILEELQAQVKDKNFAYVEFLNIFMSIIIGLYYQVWLKTSLSFMHSSPSGPYFQNKKKKKEIAAISGFTVTGFDANIRFKSFFTSQNRSKSILKNMLDYYLQVPLKIIENIWEELTPVHDTIFDPITNEQLLGDAEGVPLWDSMPGNHTKFSIIIGPIDHKKYRKFVPWGPNFRNMCRLIEDYLDAPWLKYDVEFLVTGLPEFDFSQGLVIGFDSFHKINSSGIMSAQFEAESRENSEIYIRKQYGVTATAQDDWPQDIFISEIEEPTQEENSLPSLVQSNINKPEYYFDTISQLEESKQEQAIRYIDREIDNTIYKTCEYAAEFPDAAKDVGIDATGNIGEKDLAQVIKYFSYLAGLIRQDIDRTQDDRLMATLQKSNPNLFLPIPATMIISCESSDKLEKCTVLPRGTLLSALGGASTGAALASTGLIGGSNYSFTTCYDTTLIPAKISRVECTRTFMGHKLRKDLQSVVKTTLVIELESVKKEITFKNMGLEFLRFYINLDSSQASLEFHDMLFMNCIGIDLYDICPNALAFSKSPNDNFLGFIPTRDLHPVGFAENEEVVPRPFKEKSNLNTPARHLMREFSLYPQKFMFFDIKNIENIIKTCGNKLQIRLHLKNYLDYNSLLYINKTPNCFQIGATPVVNLFAPKTNIKIIRENEESFSVLHEEDKSDKIKVYPYHITEIKLSQSQKRPILKPESAIFSQYAKQIKWRYSETTLFSDPLESFSSIEIINPTPEKINPTQESITIDCLAQNNIDFDIFEEFSDTAQIINTGFEPLIRKIFIHKNSFSETKQNPHLLKGPLPFLHNLHISNFYYFDNLNRSNLNEYLETFITNEIESIQKFNDILDHIETSIITGEGRLPPKQSETFITNGLKFCFEFNETKIKVENKYKTPEIFLLMHIIGEHLSEMCSDLSFVKLSYKFYPDRNSRNMVEENYFNKKIYLGKRSY